MRRVADVTPSHLLQQVDRRAGHVDLGQRRRVRYRNGQAGHDRQSERYQPVQLHPVSAQLVLRPGRGARPWPYGTKIVETASVVCRHPAIVSRRRCQYGARIAFLSSLPIAL